MPVIFPGQINWKSFQELQYVGPFPLPDALTGIHRSAKLVTVQDIKQLDSS
jgi:hypothetical protein